MSEFKLMIVTPDGIVFDGNAESVVVRTVSGDVGILKGHEPYTAPLGIGRARVKLSDEWKNAACFGGVIYVDNEMVKIIANTFEWADDINISRAEKAADNAKKIIETAGDEKVLEKAHIKLHRALTRLDIANGK